MKKNIIKLINFSLLALLVSSTSLAEDSLTFLFQKQKEPQKVKADADSLAKNLSTEINQHVVAKVPLDYSSAVQAIVSKTADFAYVDSMAYLLAKRDGNAKLILAEQRTDLSGTSRTEYDSVFVVSKKSKLKSYEDISKNSKNLSIAFTSPTSTSGYLMPMRRFVKTGLLKAKQSPKEIFKNIRFAGSYTNALNEVFSGRADICAVSSYAFEGKSSSKYVSQEMKDALKILARTPGVPTHVIIARSGINKELLLSVKNAILKISTDKPELLSDVYGASKFVEVDSEEHVNNSLEAIEATGLPLLGIVKKKI